MRWGSDVIARTADVDPEAKPSRNSAFGEVITFDNKNGWGEAYEVIAVAHRIGSGAIIEDLIIRLICFDIK